MSLHNKHQYFYEKYLRDEMPEGERKAFEEKLSSDELFRKSFQFYKANRGRLLKELVEEDEQQERRWTLNSWIYLLISVIGIILTVNYYFSAEEGATARTKPRANPQKGILDRINIFQKDPEPSAPAPAAVARHPKQDPEEVDTVNTEEKDEEVALAAAEAEAVSVGTEGAGIVNDVMEADTFITAIDKSYFDARLKAIRSETDSILQDSILQDLAMKSAGRNTEKARPVFIFVEFWKSPVNFRGYRFNGKKLILYGIPAPYHVSLLRDGDDFTLSTGREDVLLIKDVNFHKL